MPVPVSTTLGVNLAYLSPTLSRTVPVNTVIKATDGRDYILSKASAAIASAAVCILDPVAMTMATGAGAWTAPTVTGGVPINNYAWFMRTLP